MHFSVTASVGKSLRSFVYVNIYCVGAGKGTLMSIFNRLDPYNFLSKDGKDSFYENRKGKKVFNSC